MLEKDCNGIPISTFPHCYAIQMIWPLGWFSLQVALSVIGKKNFETVVGGRGYCCQPLCRRQREKNLGATIRIGREILCLPYAGFLDALASLVLLIAHSLTHSPHQPVTQNGPPRQARQPKKSGKLLKISWGYTLAEVWQRPWKRCNNYFTKTFFQIPYLIHRPTTAPVAAENQR